MAKHLIVLLPGGCLPGRARRIRYLGNPRPRPRARRPVPARPFEPHDGPPLLRHLHSEQAAAAHAAFSPASQLFSESCEVNEVGRGLAVSIHDIDVR